ncbi:transcription initiation factor [Fusarium heterosporum]|uniref:Transcription initiation factor n=1 Tax=Fusarium heterosporum TaxID=42747 RepID=A0A8H5TYD2_FUSHE|nr:transcription initiation factor [Fusarium heterosporum]
MSLEVIYVTRHGFRSGWSVDPLTGVYSASIRSPTGIPADPALTSHGVSQAKEMGKHLMTLDPPIDAVYSSPYYRCLQTITPFVELKQQQLNNELNIQGSATATICPEHGIGEFFGAAPFDHPIPASPDRLKELFPAYDDTCVSVITPSRKGETIKDLYVRVAAAMQGIIDRCDAEGKRAVVLCTHAAVVIALGRVLTGRIPDAVEEEDFHAFTCGLSRYRRRGTRRSSVANPNESQASVSERSSVGEWQCELDSDCSFLSSGEERGWKFSGDESFPGTGSMSQGDVDSKL